LRVRPFGVSSCRYGRFPAGIGPGNEALPEKQPMVEVITEITDIIIDTEST
jgi:hypothetical protein